MKKIILITTFFVLSCMGVKAQINLIGAGINSSSGLIDIVKWQALDSSSVSNYPTILEGYYYSSSVFNSYTANYYLTGITADTSVLLSFNTDTNTSGISSYRSFSNITEIDMSTGKIYNLTADSIDYFSVNEYDISTGTDSVLGVIHEPGIPGIITDATSFDSNNGILYYIGYDSLPGLCLYSIPVRNSVFSYSKTRLQLNSPGNNFSSVNYDNVNNILYASDAQFDPTGNYQGNTVVEINTITGEVIERGQLTGFPYYLAGSSSFDQNSGNLLLVGFDTAFNEKMIVFNTYTNTFQTGFVPDMVSEIVCDNYDFAKSAYLTTTIKEKEDAGIMLFPNPATNKFTLQINMIKDNYLLILSSASCKVLLTEQIQNPETEISTEFLPAGVYIVTLKSAKSIQTQKLIIQ